MAVAWWWPVMSPGVQGAQGATGLVQTWGPGEDSPNVALRWGFQWGPFQGLVPRWGEGMHEGFGEPRERKWLRDLQTTHMWFI